MKNGMSLESLLEEVVRQTDTKRDFVASTKEALRMVDFEGKAWIVLHREGHSELERFTISENAHRQIASRLGIPWKYFQRLLTDHLDLVIAQVNALFEREPETRLLRTLDGQARAFLSDRYRALDNYDVLSQVLPPIVHGDIKSELLSSNVGENKMHLKILFTDESLAQDIGEAPRSVPAWALGGDAEDSQEMITARDAGRDIVRPGAIISNSETGHGALRLKLFFFRGWCRNGCVYGSEEAFAFNRHHVGGKLLASEDFEVFSDATKRKQDELIIAEVSDALGTMVDPARVLAMGDRLRAIKAGEKVGDAFAAVDKLAVELDLRESEKSGILESFIRDGDYSQWGMVNAVTEQANKDEVSYDRACELEELGAEIIKFSAQRWQKVAEAQKVAA